MSQVVTDLQDNPDRLRSDRNDWKEFDYHPIPALAPITMFLGVCSLGGLVAVPFLAIAAVGVLTGLVCLRQIRRSEGELGGRVLARLGFWLNVVCLVAGTSWHSYAYATEVPEGYERVSFSWLSGQELDFQKGGRISLPEGVAALDGKPIFIKGYMYPTRQLADINEFVLVKDTGQCCFGGNPKLTDMIVVQFKDGMTVSHKDQTLVSVAGVFRAKHPQQSGELYALYSIEGAYFK